MPISSTAPRLPAWNRSGNGNRRGRRGQNWELAAIQRPSEPFWFSRGRSRTGGRTMMRTVRGKVRGRTIELDEDLGVPEGQAVEVQVTVVPTATGTMSEGLAKVHAILCARFDSVHKDTAGRLNAHNPVP